MKTLAVLIPVLGRPQNVAPLVRSLELSTVHERADGWTVTPLFLCSQGDDEQIAAVKKSGAKLLLVGSTRDRCQYSRKINAGAAATDTDWLFLGADDLDFHPGWLRTAVSLHVETGKLVIGTNDLGNPSVKAGRHATHSLVHRDYVTLGTIDQPGLVLHEGYDHNSCNPPEAPVWMADLSFKPLGDIRVGDEVMGWHRPLVHPRDPAVIDEILASDLSNRKIADLVGVSATHVQSVRTGKIAFGEYKRPWNAPLKRLCAGEVLAVQRRTAPLVRVIMESGRELRCTLDHLWLNGRFSPSNERPDREWIRAEIGRALLHVIDQPRPLRRDEEWLAGWLGGIYDGEGSGVYAATQSVFANPDVCAAIMERLSELGLPHSIPDGTMPGVKHFSLLGGRQTFLNFLAWCRPVKSQRLEDKIKNTARFGMRDEIVGMELAGEGEVIAMTTTTGNYVVWGYASKNCDVEFVETAKSRDQFAFAFDSHVEHLHPLWDRRVRRDTTYHKGMSNSTRDRQLYYTRRKLWGNTDSRPILPLIRTAGAAHARRRQMARWPKK